MKKPPKPLTVIVCGARDWKDRRLIREWLAKLPPGSVVVHGACHLGGADIIAGEEARSLGFEVREYPVDHAVDGPWPGAGPRRNQRMLDAEAPDAVLAFSWVAKGAGITSGTADMVSRALSAGVRSTIIPPRRLDVQSLLQEPAAP